jgi:trehalose-phosphatase
METLHPSFDPEAFFDRLRSARERLLLLDYDGTLAPFHKYPEHALPYPGVEEVLGRIVRETRTRVAIVSGRRLVDLRGPLARLPHDEVWASHGWERLAAGGTRTDHEPTSEARRQLMLAAPMANRLAMYGARVERKIASVAVHWRGVPEPNATIVRERLAKSWESMEGDLDLLPFDGGLELRARGRTKADAVRDALAGSGDGCTCAYLGDDFSDEDAFGAMQGRGATVLVRPTLRPTRADLWIRPPEELLAFLNRWHRAGVR